MRSTLLLSVAAIGLAALLGAPSQASAGWGGTHASDMMYPQYVYHPPYRPRKWRGCRHRSAAYCGDARAHHPWLQHNPRYYYRFRNMGWNW
jgi:hypothetical protein